MGTTPRKRGRPAKADFNPHQHHQTNDDGQTIGNGNHEISDYELFREERIKENLERMQKLGILHLSLKIKSLKPTPQNSHPSNRKTPLRLSPLPPSGPTRRSSRLQNVTPASYSEVHLSKKDASLEEEEELLRGGFKPEVYTEEHEKLLGSTEMNWTLFVDGCGENGKRIYDPVNGKTCHQCRQKTLGHRTHCTQCNMVQGQFCGDCLYMRYGEHVVEANQNPNWVCPVCRGICNCSLCRQAKGWPPTGALYRKVLSLGFKSVAHYLIQTRRIKAGSEKNSNIKVPVTAKRSLPFSDFEMTEEKKFPDSSDPQCLVKETNSNLKVPVTAKQSLPFSDIEMTEEKEFPDSSDPQGLVNFESDGKELEYDHKSERDRELSSSNSRSADRKFASDKTTQHIHLHKPILGKEKEAEDLDSKNTDDILASPGAKEPIQKPVNSSGSITRPVQNLVGTKECILNSTDRIDDSQGLLSPYSEEKKDGEIKSKEEEKCIKSNGNPPHATEPNTDSIAGRLKRRRRSRGDKED